MAQPLDQPEDTRESDEALEQRFADLLRHFFLPALPPQSADAGAQMPPED